MFNSGTVLVYTCFITLDIQYKPLNIFIEKGAGAGGEQAACYTVTASQGEACTLPLFGISPVLELSKNLCYFLNLNSLPLAII